MESETPAWLNMLIAWAPFILLIGFWILYIRKGGFMSMQTRYWQRSVAFMDRQEQLLERIATALEERNKGGR